MEILIKKDTKLKPERESYVFFAWLPVITSDNYGYGEVKRLVWLQNVRKTIYYTGCSVTGISKHIHYNYLA